MWTVIEHGTVHMDSSALAALATSSPAIDRAQQHFERTPPFLAWMSRLVT